MKITGIEAWEVSMKLAIPFEVAYGKSVSSDNVFLRVKTDGGVVGYGASEPSRARS